MEKGAGDLDDLPVRERERARELARIDAGDREALEDITGSRGQEAAANQARSPPRLLADEEVFSDREPGEERELLEDRADAESTRPTRAREGHVLAADSDDPGLGSNHASEHLDER